MKKVKRIIAVLLISIIAIILSSCGKSDDKQIAKTPEVSQMKSICELAVMDCYYHNVAKYSEKDAEGILLWKKDMHFWIEYSGIVKIGIDASLVNMSIEDTKVTITIPPAKVLSKKVDEATFTEKSFFIDKDSAKVEAEDQTKAFKAAQDNMVKAASEDTALLASAQARAQKLLENYINNIGDAFGQKYTIEWKYVDDPNVNVEVEEEK